MNLETIVVDIKAIRRQNLRLLISDTIQKKQFETQEKFAEGVEIDPSYLSQMLMLPEQRVPEMYLKPKLGKLKKSWD
jgi:hypothetical protein